MDSHVDPAKIGYQDKVKARKRGLRLPGHVIWLILTILYKTVSLILPLPKLPTPHVNLHTGVSQTATVKTLIKKYLGINVDKEVK